MSLYAPLFVIGFSLIFGAFALVLLVFYMKSHRLRIRSPRNGGGSYVEGDFWMMERKKKEDGSTWWVSAPWQTKLKIPTPPSEVIDIGKKGRKYVEVSKIGIDEYVYMRDGGINIKIDELESGEIIKDVFKPFSVTQRETLVNQFKRAEADRPKDKIQLIMQMGPMILMFIIIVLGFIYWGEIMEANRASAGTASSMMKEAKMFVDDLKEGAKSVSPAPQSNSGVSGEGDEPPS